MKEDAAHVIDWAAAVETMREQLIAAGAAGEVRVEVLELAAKATRYDNWHFAEGPDAS